MIYGENMPSKGSKNRLVDVLDKISDLDDNSIILTKFILLLQRMEDTNPNIDNFELRWVENRINRLKDGETLTKNDLLTANLYWNKWK